MDTTLSELRAQRQALDAQIQEKEAELARSGESVVIDGQKIDSVMNIEGELPTPQDTDFFPTYRKERSLTCKEM